MPPPETMKVLKPLARRYVEQLDHRLVDEIGIGPVEARMAWAVAIQSLTLLVEFLRRHAGMGAPT